MTEEKDIALVTGYLENQLGPDDRESVEKRLSEEPEFQALYQDLSQLTKGMEHLTHAQLLARIDRLEENLGDPLAKKAETKTIFWTFQRLAAAFIGLAIVAFASWYGLSGSQAMDGAELYNEYYQVYENSVVPTYRGEDDPGMLNRTFQAYDQADYEKAAVLFENLMEGNESTYIKLFAGLTYIELDQPNKASGLLEMVINSDDGYKIQASWYLALMHLKNEQQEKTIPLLESLVVEETTYAPRAKELLSIIR